MPYVDICAINDFKRQTDQDFSLNVIDQSQIAFQNKNIIALVNCFEFDFGNQNPLNHL